MGFACGVALLPGCLLIDPFDGTYVVAPPAAAVRCEGRWSHVYGGAKAEQTAAIASASGASTTLYVTGSFTGELDLGGAALSADEGDAFVGVFDGDGNPLRSTHLGGPGNQRGQAIAVAGSRLVLAGTFDGGIAPCAPSDALAAAGVFVMIVDALSLNVEATRCFGAQGTSVEVAGVAIDGTKARVVGSFDGSLGTDMGELAATDGDVDGFVVSLDVLTGATSDPPVRIGGEGETVVSGVAALPGGGFVVVGGFDGTLELDPTASGADPDAFAAAFSDSVQLSFATWWGGEGDQQLTGVAVDATRVLLVGELDEAGRIDFGSGSVAAPASGVTGFVAALPLAGDQGELGPADWVVPLSADDLDMNAVAVTERAVYAAGLASGSLRVAGGSPPGAAASDIFAVRIALDTGAVTLTSRCGDADEQAIVGLAASSQDDDVFFVGSLRGWVDFGPLQQQHSHGESDVLVGELVTPE